MSSTDYMAILYRSLMENAEHANAINEAAAILSGRHVDIVKQRTGNDPDGFNDLIDALIDKVVATCEGSTRAAIFSLLSAYGNAMHELHGPPGGALR